MRKALILVLICFTVSMISAQCIEGNCNTGFGTAIFKKKGNVKYSGYFKSKRPHGKGTAEYPNGRVYSGDWAMGMWHGQGTLMLTDGSAMKGNWEYNKFKSYSNYDSNIAIVTAHDNSSKELQNAEKPASRNSQRGVQNNPSFNRNEAVNQGESTASISTSHTVLPEIWALAIGVSQYENQTIPSLKYPDNDAFGMFSFWKSPEGGSLDDEHSEVLVDDAATKAMVLHSLRSVFLKAKENDLAIFFFSGHGLKGSFLPTDYDGDDIRIYHSEINKILADCPAKNKLVIADACHSGSYMAAKGLKDSHPTKENTEHYFNELSKAQPGIVYLLSSQADEESLEVSTLHNSVFTYFVLRGLKGEANANGDNIVTIKELFDYVHLNVTDYANKLGKVQTPVIKGTYDPNMPVSVVKRQ
jgi:hypothetical protein